MHTRQWIRINRTVRDIPTDTVSGGIQDINGGQIIQQYMQRHGWYSPDIRARTVNWDDVTDISKIKERVITYKSFGATEYFLEVIYDVEPFPKCIGFLRLRLDKMAGYNHDDEIIFYELLGCAMIRELHVYGNAIQKGDTTESAQHRGYGQKLVNKAIQIAKEVSFSKISVIAGDGVKLYYKNKFGFQEKGSFMIKELFNDYELKMKKIDLIILTITVVVFSYFLYFN